LATTNFDFGGKDHAFSRAFCIVHFAVVYTRGLLKKAIRYNLRCRQPERGCTLEHCRRERHGFSGIPRSSEKGA
jgi:hypothetical protein